MEVAWTTFLSLPSFSLGKRKKTSAGNRSPSTTNPHDLQYVCRKNKVSFAKLLASENTNWLNWDIFQKLFQNTSSISSPLKGPLQCTKKNKWIRLKICDCTAQCWPAPEKLKAGGSPAKWSKCAFNQRGCGQCFSDKLRRDPQER